MTPKITVEQSEPTLLKPEEKPPAPEQNGTGATPGAGEPVEGAVVSKAYTEEWVRKLVTYACKSLADEFNMPELRVSVIELELMTPALTAVLNAHAPDVVSGTDPRASVIFVALMIVVMGGRRALIISRRKKATGEKIAGTPKPQKPPAPNPAAPAIDPMLTAGAGAFGSQPVVLGGELK